MSRHQLRTPQSPASQVRRNRCTLPGLAWAFLSALLVLGVSCSQSEPERTSVILELSEANFQHEVVESTQPVLVEFWAPWCQPCLEMKPVLKEFATEQRGRIKVGTLNIDDHPRVADAFDVGAPPVLLLFHDGNVAKRRVGFRSKAELEQMLALSSPPSQSELVRE